ncbi:MAG: hypothetical protein J5I93_20780 [Pirellulaceae bacterium]|nr:hypothetical protein [Pirellulaceae bacterium]
MKIWKAYGSEHSMNLVMIGHFKTIDDAKRAKELIDEISAVIGQASPEPMGDLPPSERRFSDEIRQVFEKSRLHTLGPAELEQFLYDIHVELKGSDIVVSTDESEISAFLKVLIENGAKVEIYSAHDYPNENDSHGQEDTDE